MSAAPHLERRVYAENARAYWDAGWHGILPLPARAKKTPPVGWTGHISRPWPSWADIQTWMDSPDGRGNIAIRMPRHVIGIDVDDYGMKRGAALLAELEDKHGPLPPTWKSTSREGVSGIRLYRVPEGLWWPGGIGDSIEIIQTGHRYLVAPPSIHPEGRTYRWVSPEGVAQLNVVPHVESLPDLPEAWVTGLTGGRLAEDIPRAELTDKAAIAWMSSNVDSKPCPLVQATLERYIVDLEQNRLSRHEVAKNATARIARLHGEGHAGAVVALTRLLVAWKRAVADRSSDREASGEWTRLITGAVRIAAHEHPTPGGSDPCDWPMVLVPQAALVSPDPPQLDQPPTPTEASTDDAAVTPAVVDEDAEAARFEAEANFRREVAAEVLRAKVREQAKRILAAEGQTRRPEPKVLADFLAEPDPPVVYRVDGLWPAGGRVMLTAAFKAGKSTLTANVIRCLVDGGELMGRWEVTPTERNVVLLDNELDEATLRRWLREQGIVNTHKVVIISLRGAVASFGITDEHVREQWATMLRKHNAGVVVLDCLRPVLDAIGLDEHKDAGRFLTAFDDMLGESGTAEAIVVHHAGHEGERARGDSRLRDWPDVEWRLVREKSGDTGDAIDPSARRYFAAYGRDVNVPEGALTYDETSRRLTYEGGNRGEAKANAAIPAVIDVLRENPSGLSGKAVEEAVMNSGASRKEARGALKAVVQRGLVRVSTGARGAFIHTLVTAGEAVDSQFSTVSSPARHTSPSARRQGEVDLASAPIGRGEVHTTSATSAQRATWRTRADGLVIDPRTGEVIDE